MAEDKKPRNLFQQLANTLDEFVDWLGETFADPEISRALRQDLGLGTDGSPAPRDAAEAQRRLDAKNKIDGFLAKDDVDKAALLDTAAEIHALIETVLTFADAVKQDGVDAWDIFWLLFKVWAADSMRVRNPSAYAVCLLAGLAIEDEELMPQLDPAMVTRLLKGETDDRVADAWLDRFTAIGGSAVVILSRDIVAKKAEGTRLEDPLKAIDMAIDAMYGWDPEPGTAVDAAVAASRALSVTFKLGGVPDPTVTIIPVPRADGGPGLLLSVGTKLEIDHVTENTVYTTGLGADGAFSLFFRLSRKNPDFRAFGPHPPSVLIEVRPRTVEDKPPVEPPVKPEKKPFVLGLGGKSRVQFASFSYGVEAGADYAGFRAHLRDGKLVIALSADGDGFLSKLPGDEIEVPFELGLLADTRNGVRFDGGTGLKVDLPVAASVFGVFNIQYIALELKLAGAEPELQVRGGFSLRLGPFQASVDQIGTSLDLGALTRGADDLGELVHFLPPKGIGLTLDLGLIKGGGYIFLDPEKGEYAGALELSFGVWGISALALITTKRPDGSDGWSLLLFVFGTFRFHLGFGIYWNGVGGMIGLHHRADVDALTAGMRTGALDDVLFPQDPVANAPRIIKRYKELFPVEADSLVVGLMLELAFSQPPIAYVRLGLMLEWRTLPGDEDKTFTKAILLGQLLVQLPPRDLGVPAIVKLLVDIVGFYDPVRKFLLIQQRLRDSFVGIEGFAKLNLTGEMLLAMQFGDDPAFVYTAGGFHPAFNDVPCGVPAKLERMAVSFGLGPLKMRNETYFAITSNSVQSGWKIELSADIDVADIHGHLAFDALLYLSPKFHFLVQLEFHVELEAFGESLASVLVRMSLAGPGEWRAKGHFSFSILWWDEEIGFDESWGSAPPVEAATISAVKVLSLELSDGAKALPGAPVGGSALVSMAAPPPGLTFAHPLAQVTITQKTVPFDVEIDRLNTRRLTEGKARFTVDAVLLGDLPVPASQREPVTEHFARSQFMEMAKEDKLAARSFERFTSGVRIGSTDYVVPGRGTTVKADYEVEILEPAPALNLHWVVASRFREILPIATGLALAEYGAAARSVQATGRALHVDVGKAVVGDAPLAIVDPTNLHEQVTVTSGPRTSIAVAGQNAARSGGLVVEAFEVSEVTL